MAHNRSGLLLAFAVLSFAATPGCGKSFEAGSNPAASTGGGGEGGGCSDHGQSCNICLSESCAEAYCACEHNASCVELTACLAPCSSGVSQCTADCRWAFSTEAAAQGVPVWGCAALSCSAPCANAFPVDRCTGCLFSECESVFTTCIENPDCAWLLGCLDECGETADACFSACAEGHQEGGAAHFTALHSCMVEDCEPDCS